MKCRGIVRPMKNTWPIMAAFTWMASMAQASPSNPGILLENLTWQEAEKVLTPETVVVIPLGAAAKEHGPHLKLKNDFLIAEYLRDRLVEKANVVVAPTLNYHFYPAFAEYPGSTSLRQDTARDVVVDIVKSLARFGPKRFYVLNTGVSTLRALKPAAEVLAVEGILLTYTDLDIPIAPIEKVIGKQAGGSHADEIETSMMLVMAPESVDMTKAVKDYHGDAPGGLTRDPKGKGVYSPSGVWGDATLATKEKGEKVVTALVAYVVKDVEDLRKAVLPRLAFKH